MVSTTGDRVTDRGFAEVGSFGVFVREIEAALLAGRVDVAVHSYKDLPSVSPADLVIAAVPERVDAADVLLTSQSAHDSTAPGFPLRTGASVGTSAARRAALLLEIRPDLDVGLLRGNVPTRLKALAEGRFDAIVLAVAGVLRLERIADALLVAPGIVRTRLDPRRYVPAPAQGAIAVQVRREDAATRRAVEAIDDPATARALTTERALLGLAEAGCNQPFGAWCESRSDGSLRLFAVLGGDHEPLRRTEVGGSDPIAVAQQAWSDLQLAVVR